MERFSDTSTSMTCPYWSITRDRYLHPPASFTDVSSTNQRSPAACRHGLATSISSRGEPLHPPRDRDMIYLDATLSQQLLDIAVGQRVAQVLRET
jgi:hypothetical protein